MIAYVFLVLLIPSSSLALRQQASPHRYHHHDTPSPLPYFAAQKQSRGGEDMRYGVVVSVVVVVSICVISDLVLLPFLTTLAAHARNRHNNPGLTGEMLFATSVRSAASPSRAGFLPPLLLNDSTCHYGGILTRQGCVCGAMTEGLQCQHLTVPQSRVDNSTMCGPECWSAYVWYPTQHFQFRPIRQDEEAFIHLAKTALAWEYGGELRQSVANSEPLDPVVLGWMTDLGPWTDTDKRMLSLFHEYRKELSRIHEVYEARLNDSQVKRDKARVVYSVIIHKDPLQFQAFWDVLYSSEHYYVIHLDAESSQEDREAIIKIIEKTPVQGGGSVWSHVELIDPDLAVKALWGDVTLIYLEVVMWLRIFLHTEWEWDYLINVSGQDIPIVPLDYIYSYLGKSIPQSFISYHGNEEQFRQSYFTPERWDEKVVVVLGTLQSEMPGGRWRHRYGQSHVYGCTQWHMLHYTMAYEFATNPFVHGLLFSLKDTAIPDESFFATAALWLIETQEKRGSKVHLSLGSGGDAKYRNEGVGRDLDHPGEFDTLKQLGQSKYYMWARKSYSAHTTCHFTNVLLGLKNDCKPYEHTKVQK